MKVVYAIKNYKRFSFSHVDLQTGLFSVLFFFVQKKTAAIAATVIRKINNYFTFHPSSATADETLHLPDLPDQDRDLILRFLPPL